MERKSLIKKFDKQANKYNKRRNNDGARKFRERIFRETEGNVLEVAIGFGLNFPFYNNRNIAEIVKNSHLKVIREERHLLGCLYLIWAKP